MQYKIVQSKPWIKDLEETLKTWTDDGWELVSHSSNTGTAGYTFIFKK